MRKLFGIGSSSGSHKAADLAAPAYSLVLTTWRVVTVFLTALSALGVRLARLGIRPQAPAPAARNLNSLLGHCY
jgi:hypothetical protein